MWAHYAGGFDGLAIGLQLNDNRGRVNSVKYENKYKVIDSMDARSHNEIAREIMLTKYLAWEYEQEIRILQNEKIYKFERITEVILGQRMNSALQNTLIEICDKEDIPIFGLEFEFDGKIKKIPLPLY